jgi:hypothetical protein
MPKVISSEGLQTFIETGKPTETIPREKREARPAAPALEMKAGNGAAPPVADAPGTSEEPKAQAKAEAKPEDDLGLDPEDHDLAERAKKRIGKKHYEMKKAQEEASAKAAEAAESERFAEQLFNEREEWRKRAEAAEKARDELKAKAEPPPAALTKPDPEKYYDDKRNFRAFDYANDLAEYTAKKAIADDRAEQEKAARAKAEEAQKAEFTKRIAKATEKYPDWQKVVGGSDLVLQNQALQYLSESEYGTDLAYFLAKNRDIAEKIKAMPAIRAIAELGKLETSFEKPANPPAKAEAASPAVERPGAPAPITPISTSGTGTINTDPAKMNFQELRAYRRQQAIDKSRR